MHRDETPAHEPAPVRAPSRSRTRWIVLSIAAVLILGTLVWGAWPRPICSDDERSAVLAVPAFGGANPPIVDSGPQTQPSTAGCGMEYEANAPAEEVAGYYAHQLAALGWSRAYVRRIPGDPLRYEVWVDSADLATHPNWENIHFIVDVTVSSPERSEVGLAVRRYVVSVY